MNDDTKIMAQLRLSLEDAMARAGIKARPLSTKAGLGETAVRDILSGRTKDIKINTVESLADALGVPFQDLILPFGPIDADRQVPLAGKIARDVWSDGLTDVKSWRTFIGRADVKLADNELRFALEVSDNSADSVYPHGTILDVVFPHQDILLPDMPADAAAPIPALAIAMKAPVVLERMRDDSKFELTVWKINTDDDGGLWLSSLSKQPQLQGSIRIAHSFGDQWKLPLDSRLARVVGAYIPWGV